MKRFVKGRDRSQLTFLPECLEDWIDENNPVRVIEAFVEALNLGELGFAGVEPETTGRPSYHPSVLLKLYIYGYLNRVQSSRRLEREAGRNFEVMWLLGRLVPDHKTIADFRKDNGLAIRKVCARFVELCREMGLLGERERCHRRQQVQGGEQSGQELHAREGGAAPGTTRGERRALSEPARYRRPAGTIGGACREDHASQGEARQAQEEMERLKGSKRRCWLRPISRYR
jgi:transposase